MEAEHLHRRRTLLPLAIERRLYGYEVVNLVQQSICGAFVRPTKTGPYSALRRLQQLGYVTTDVEESVQRRQAGRRRWDDHRHSNKRWYRATPEGLRAYERWVTGKIEDEPEGGALLVRVAIAARLGTEGLRKVLRECEALCNEREQALEALQAREASGAGIDALCDRLVLSERRIALRGVREWIGVARDEIDAYERRETQGRRAGAATVTGRGDARWRRS